MMFLKILGYVLLGAVGLVGLAAVICLGVLMVKAVIDMVRN